ncbi:MAG: pilus assembly protein N-terminal domain-containing protein [Cyanobacteria bacterium NC_groundwater_1444_Ag_S-0.65um_54_12]|nr:pilus assembly protein N-terminal domain-containing protein [Cyanobacteria bacterium NC_groundwater_1444_Ag_S-0.65um_54_12]
MMKEIGSRRCWRVPVILLLILWCLGPASAAQARAPDVVIPLGQMTIFTVPYGVSRVAIGDGNIANVTPVQDGTGRTLLIEAKKAGLTNFLVWQNSGLVQNYLLEVLSSRRPETIAIRIKVLEIREGDSSNLGIKWFEQIKFKEAPPPSPFRLGLPIRDSLLDAAIDLLLQEKKAKLLAQPTLVTMNGRYANFLAGGELPLVVQTPNTVAVEWKTFGVGLSATPSLEGVDSVVLELKPEVSTIDRQNGIMVGNFNIPAIATRYAEATVALKSGESVVLAGLLRQESREVKSKLPILGQIPILGALFTTTLNETENTELVFIVSPTIIRNNEVKPEADYGKAN